MHCFSATAPLSGNSRRGWENSSGKTALGSALDNNGNTLTKVVGSNTTTYAWDFENRLTSVTLPGSGGTVYFKYDPFGRRIYKSSSSATSVYAFDSDRLLEETNGTGAVVARYAQGLKLDEPLAMLRSSTTSYYNADGLGSITSLSNGAGALAQTYTFDSFGKQTASTGSLVNSFQYTARESDSETGLYFLRNRYYDPAAGRFISEDPINFFGGENFYRYVYNSPVGLTDPMGLSANDVKQIQELCHDCVDQMVAAGQRLPSGPRPSGSFGDFLRSVLFGWTNDAGYWFTKQESCYGQAQIAKPCLENPPKPYDAKKWTFDLAPVWFGSHRVVEGHSSDPSDPIVICDPWLDRSSTLPNPVSPKGGAKK
ncbi:MAG: RHS repeat-associated core domain-containing protein [Candidatus Acidiferrum sp.]